MDFTNKTQAFYTHKILNLTHHTHKKLTTQTKHKLSAHTQDFESHTLHTHKLTNLTISQIDKTKNQESKNPVIALFWCLIKFTTTTTQAKHKLSTHTQDFESHTLHTQNGLHKQNTSFLYTHTQDFESHTSHTQMDHTNKTQAFYTHTQDVCIKKTINLSNVRQHIRNTHL